MTWPAPALNRARRSVDLTSRHRDKHVLVLSFIGLVGPAAALAEASGPRQSGPHVHGIARLTIAIEGSRVLAELSSPAATLIGFEHPPRTAAERETFAMAKENLMTGDAMIRLNTAAGCRLESADVEAEWAEAGHGHDPDGDDGHADFEVSYRFDCDRPAEISSAALGLFAGFPALERVLVQYVIAAGQGGAELTPGQPVVSFVPF